MGPRLGFGVVVRISNWFRVSKKSRSYPRLQSENTREAYRVPVGDKLSLRSVNSPLNFPDSNSTRASSPVNFTVSPILTVKSPSDDHSQPPYLQILGAVRRLILATQFPLSRISKGSKKGRLEELSDEMNSSRRIHVPKGFLAVCVGQAEEKQCFKIPVMHLNDPLFVELLKEAEEEYGYYHEGIIKIRCEVADFQNVQKLIGTKHKGQLRY